MEEYFDLDSLQSLLAPGVSLQEAVELLRDAEPSNSQPVAVYREPPPPSAETDEESGDEDDVGDIQHLSGLPGCDFTNVKIDPCPEAATNEPCKIKRGHSATLTYNFTPRWSPGGGELKTRAYWASVLDLPFLGMNTDVCKYANCPLVKDQQNFYNFTLQIEKKYPAQAYKIKYRIWEDEAEPKKECCLIFNLKLV